MNLQFSHPIQPTQIARFYADVNKFNKKLKDTVGTEREKLILEVEVADQTASTEFFLNGEAIKPSDRIEIKNLGGGKHQLIFNSLELTDQGEIKCKSGRLKSTCQLSVNKGEGKPEINLESPVEGPTGKMLIVDVPYTGKLNYFGKFISCKHYLMFLMDNRCRILYSPWNTKVSC